VIISMVVCSVVKGCIYMLDASGIVYEKNML
jgi:hypothetical protein